MKYTLSTILLIILLTASYSYGQITFTKIPLNKQLIGRNLSTNTGQVIIEGSSNTVNYQNIQIDIYRNNVFINSVSNNLNYVSNIADFNFNIPITAELANYSFKIYSENDGVRILEKEIIDIVAGDVYIIQGQSNAQAKKKWKCKYISK